MNLKYYLRGLGIGILVTAVIMLVISHNNQSSMTDEQIKMRAAELGMVDGSTTLSQLASQSEEMSKGSIDTPSSLEEDSADVNKKTVGDSDMSLDEIEEFIDEADAYLDQKQEEKPKESAKPTKTPKPTVEPTEEPTKAPETTVEPTEEPTKAPEPTAEPTVEPTKTPEESKPAGSSISLSVRQGEGSFAVAKELKSLGLISDASSFDDYLCSTGMDRRIYAGNYSIPEGSSEEDIALIITGKKR